MRGFMKNLLALFFIVCLTACSPLRMLNTFTPNSAAYIEKNISYGPLDRQKLDIYVPVVSKEAPPVVVFFYGGNWNSGQRMDYAFVGQALASRGILAVVADYRLYPQVRYPEILQDAAMALAWTAQRVTHYGGDAKRLFVMGHSAGAYNAAMVALDRRWLAAHGMTPDILQGWIGLAGPYDFLPIQNPDVRPVFFYPDTPPESQPIMHVSETATPALLITARHDAVVNPMRNTGGLAKALRMKNVSVGEIYFDGVGHATLVATFSTPLRHLAPTLDVVERFVKSNGKTNAINPMPMQ